jgi:hypothetical protein
MIKTSRRSTNLNSQSTMGRVIHYRGSIDAIATSRYVARQNIRRYLMLRSISSMMRNCGSIGSSSTAVFRHGRTSSSW